MPFNTSAISGGEQTSLQAGGQAAEQYLLIWDNEVIFKAQVTGQADATRQTQILFTNVTTGAYTDIKQDFVIAISDEENFEDVPQHRIFRVRADNDGTVATPNSININETSANIDDDQYILVVKDIREETKRPLVSNSDNSYYKDAEIEFRRLLPVIYNLQSAYIAALISGSADIAFDTETLITDNDATSSKTYSWDADGGTFQVGSSTSEKPTIRYTSSGTYMPIVTVTDSNGNSNYFAIRVWVIPADLSDTINLSFDGAKIEANVRDGYSCSINAIIKDASDARMQIDDMADYTFCAVWQNATETPLNSFIKFIGRFREETVTNARHPVWSESQRTQFKIDGLASIMGRMTCYRIGMKEKDSPTRFDEIENLTPQRAIAYYLTEHTTIANTHSLSFEDFDETFRFPNFGTEDGNVLESIQSIAWQYTAGIEFAPTGELRIARNAVYRDSTSRSTLTTIADWDEDDIQVEIGGGAAFSIKKSYINRVGSIEAGGAVYNTTTGEVQVIKSMVPAFISGGGQETQTFNSQILTADDDLQDAIDELGQRVQDDLAAVQPRIILSVSHPDAYDFLVPSLSNWFTWTIPESANNRGIAYTTSDRWILDNITSEYVPERGRRIITARYLLETEGSSDYQVAATIPTSPPTTINTPVTPVVPGYPEMPSDPDILYPDPSDPDEDDTPPFGGDDLVPITPDPQPPPQGQGNVGVLWSASTIMKVTGTSLQPTYADYTPQNKEVADIVDVKPDYNSNKLWAIGYSSTTEWGYFWKTNSFGDLQYTLNYILGREPKMLRLSSESDELYIYEKGVLSSLTYQYDEASGSAGNTFYGDQAELNYITTDPYTPSPYYIGEFTSGTGYDGLVVDYTDFPSGFASNRIFLFQTLDNPVYVTTVEINYTLNKGYITGGTNWGIRQGSSANDTVPTLSDYKSLNSMSNGTQTETITLNTTVKEYGFDIRSSRGPWSSTSVTPGVIRINWIRFNYSTSDKAMSKRKPPNTILWDASVEIGDAPTGDGAFDTQFVGDYKLGSDDTDVKQKTDDNPLSSYATETNGTPSAGEVNFIHFYGNSAVSYIFGQDTLSGSTALYKVTGGSRSDITPYDGSHYGVPVGPNCGHVSLWDSNKFWIICDFNGTRKLCFSTDAGSNWTIYSTIDNNTFWVRSRNDNVIVIVSTTKWWYSSDGGATVTEHAAPGIGNLLGFEFI